MLEAERLAREAAERTRELTDLEAQKTAARATVADLERRVRTARHAARQAAAAAKRARGKSGRS
jgi:hypothetical protein